MTMTMSVVKLFDLKKFFISITMLLQSSVRILSQIGQDTAITEQQIKMVKCQMDKTNKLKKV